MNKGWIAFAGVVLAVLLLAIVVVPFFVNADTFRPTVESQLSAALGRTVTLGRLTSSLLGGTLVADDIAIADDPKFSSVPFIQAKKLDVGVEVFPLLFHKQVHITKLNIDSPSIQLIQHSDRTWNFSSLGGGSAQPAARQSGSIPDLSVEELKITNGSASVSAIPATAKPFEYTDVNLTVKHFSFLKTFPFDLTAKQPAGGTLKL
jgi:AsmA protein